MMLKEISIILDNAGMSMSITTKNVDPYEFTIKPEQIDSVCDELQKIKSMFYKQRERN